MRIVTVVGRFDLGWRVVVELAVEPVLVAPTDPAAGRYLEVVESPPRSSVGGQGGGVAVQLNLEQPDG